MTFVPPHVHTLDEALQLNIYVGECQRVLTGDVRKRINDAEKELTELLKVRKAGEKGTTKIINNVEFTAADRKAVREKCLNGKKVKKNRKWLQNILLAESSSEDESNPKVDDMLRLHKVRLRCLERFYQKPKLRRFKYYGAGLIVNNNEVSDCRPNPPILPVPKATGKAAMNGGAKRGGSSSFAQLDMPGTSGFSGSAMPPVAPKISPRKPKKKKQVLMPPLPISSSLTVPEILPPDHGANFQNSDLIAEFQQDNGLGLVLDNAPLPEMPHAVSVDVVDLPPNILMSTATSSSAIELN